MSKVKTTSTLVLAFTLNFLILFVSPVWSIDEKGICSGPFCMCRSDLLGDSCYSSIGACTFQSVKTDCDTYCHNNFEPDSTIDGCKPK
ncbi:MAG: hypothetical protein H0U75_00140 [Legionella sp.]|nr:hypothetical protein [Legionella sp.]